jgi:hypothetical protein
MKFICRNFVLKLEGLSASPKIESKVKRTEKETTCHAGNSADFTNAE